MLNNRSKNSLDQKAFTIIELLIVIVVISILATIVFITYNRIQGRAQSVVTKRIAQQYTKGLAAYKAVHSRYPSQEDIDFVDTRGCLGTGYSSTCGSDNSPVSEVPKLNEILTPYVGKTPNISPHDVPLVVDPGSGLTITLTGIAYYIMNEGDSSDLVDGNDIAFNAIAYALDEPNAKCGGGTVLKLTNNPNEFESGFGQDNTMTDSKNTACFIKLPD